MLPSYATAVISMILHVTITVTTTGVISMILQNCYDHTLLLLLVSYKMLSSYSTAFIRLYYMLPSYNTAILVSHYTLPSYTTAN